MQIFGVASTAIGVALIVYAKRSMEKASEAKRTIDKFTDFFSHNPKIWNPLIEFFGGKAQQEASKYDPLLTVLFYSGIALVVFGIWCIFRFRRR
jgi:hypothetical protein